MKKTVFVWLLLVLLVGVCGCSSPLDKPPEPTQELSVPLSMRQDETDPDFSFLENLDDEEALSETANEIDAEYDELATYIDPICLLNEQNVEIYLISYRLRSGWGPKLGLRLVNHTDSEINFGVNFAAINGYEMSASFSEYLDPGDDRVTKLQLSEPDIDRYGFTTVEDVSLVFQIHKTEPWEPIILSDTLTAVIPGNENTGAYIPEGETVYDENGVTIILGNTVTEYDPVAGGSEETDAKMVSAAELYVANTADQIMMVDVKDLQIDGVRLKEEEGATYVWTAVRPGMRTVVPLHFEKEELQGFGLDGIHEISASFLVTIVDTPWDDAGWQTLVQTEPAQVSMTYAPHLYSGEPVAVMDQDGVTCTLTDIWKSYKTGDIHLYFQLENHSGKNLTIETDDVFINGIQIGTTLFQSVDDGETITGALDVNRYIQETFDLYGIGTVYMRMGFIEDGAVYVYDNITYSPYTTIQVSDMADSVAEPEGILLYDTDTVKVILESYGYDRFDLKSLNLFFKNTGDRNIHIETAPWSMVNSVVPKNKESTAVDIDVMVPAGSAALKQITFENGQGLNLDDVTDVQFGLKLTDVDTGEKIEEIDPVKLVLEK